MSQCVTHFLSSINHHNHHTAPNTHNEVQRNQPPTNPNGRQQTQMTTHKWNLSHVSCRICCHVTISNVATKRRTTTLVIVRHSCLVSHIPDSFQPPSLTSRQRWHKTTTQVDGMARTQDDNMPTCNNEAMQRCTTMTKICHDNATTTYNNATGQRRITHKQGCGSPFLLHPPSH